MRQWVLIVTGVMLWTAGGSSGPTASQGAAAPSTNPRYKIDRKFI